MKRTLIALTCSLAFAGASALAQDTGSQHSTSQSSGPSLTDKAKSAMHRLGDATRNMFHKAGDKTEQAKSDHDTKSMGASRGDVSDSDSGRQKRMDQAYDDYQSKSKTGHSSTSASSSSAKSAPKHETQ